VAQGWIYGNDGLRVLRNPTLPGWRPYRHLVVPASVHAVFDRPTLDVIVELLIEMHDARASVERCTTYRRPAGPPVSGAVLRTISVERMMAEALLAASRVATSREGDRITTRATEARDAGSVDELVHARTRRGPRTLDNEHYQQVGEAYRSGEMFGRPVLEVIEHFSAGTKRLPRATANRWIKEARRRGYLSARSAGPVEECEQCHVTTRAAHHVTAVMPQIDGYDDGGAGSVTATYCPKHCPGNCDKEHD
jgi:hypothetical protein